MRDVAWPRLGLTATQRAKLCYGGIILLAIAPPDGDIGPCPGKAAGEGQPQSAIPPGDDCDMA